MSCIAVSSGPDRSGLDVSRLEELSGCSDELALAASSANRLYFLFDFLTALDFLLAASRPLTRVLASSPSVASSMRSLSSRLASLRFWSLDRVAWHLTTIPVGA